MSKQRRIDALRALAARPGTEAEGRVAKEKLAKLEEKNQCKIKGIGISTNGLSTVTCAVDLGYASRSGIRRYTIRQTAGGVDIVYEEQ